jgi:hypothetical protein
MTPNTKTNAKKTGEVSYQNTGTKEKICIRTGVRLLYGFVEAHAESLIRGELGMQPRGRQGRRL